MSYLGKVKPTVALTSSDIVDGAITTDKIVDDAVTDVKVANAINTSIAANTAKVTNATHTGDVTGATALTIATDAVDIAMLSATGTASATTFLRGDNAWASAGGTNTPAFHAYLSTDPTFTRNTWTKVNCDTELVDIDSAYDNSTNYRFTVPVGSAGTYVLYGATRTGTSNSEWNYGSLAFYKNGTNYIQTHVNASTNYGRKYIHYLQAMETLSEGDYFELYVMVQTSSSDPTLESGTDKSCYFGGWKVLT